MGVDEAHLDVGGQAESGVSGHLVALVPGEVLTSWAASTEQISASQGHCQV